MLENIQTGQKVQVTVAKQPTNAAAKITLARLLAKDPGVAREQRRLTQVREATKRKRIRAGREWISRPVKKHPVRGEQGESGTIVASYDVLQDLKRVAPFVEVSAAS